MSDTGGRTKQDWAFMLPKDNCAWRSKERCFHCRFVSPTGKIIQMWHRQIKHVWCVKWPLTQDILGREIFSWWQEIAQGNAKWQAGIPALICHPFTVWVTSIFKFKLISFTLFAKWERVKASLFDRMAAVTPCKQTSKWKSNPAHGSRKSWHFNYLKRLQDESLPWGKCILVSI